MDDLDTQLITCPRMAGCLRLLPASCAQNWRRSRKSEPWDSVFVCRGCEVGARHAGETIPLPAVPPKGCCYCGKTDRRLICKSLCVSCANRIFEILRGRYRRHTPPGLMNRLHAFHIVIEDESE